MADSKYLGPHAAFNRERDLISSRALALAHVAKKLDPLELFSLFDGHGDHTVSTAFSNMSISALGQDILVHPNQDLSGPDGLDFCVVGSMCS